METEAFKYGMFSYYGTNTPLDERLRKIRDANFDATMLWWGDSRAFQEFDKRQLVQKARANDLVIENIHIPFVKAHNIWSIDEDSRLHVLGEYMNWLDDCSDFEIPIMVMHVSGKDQPDAPNEFGLRFMETLVQRAERNKVKIALENSRNNGLIEILLTDLNSDYLGLCYDTSHAHIHGDTYFRILKVFGDRILCFHLSDNDGQEDRHWNIGKGTIDWDKFIEAFPKTYHGILSAETVPKDESISEEKFLLDAYTRLIDLGQRICKSR
jgi:sugar phosphate isomerase/epimerase